MKNSNMLIDTHAHIYLEQFNDDLMDVLDRSKSAGISQILLPNIDSSSIESMNRLCSQYPDVFKPMMGLHPCSVKTDNLDSELELVYSELKKGHYIAVGEIGLDLYWDKTTLKAQQQAFKQQIDWALDMDLPIAIHARDSFQEIFEVMQPYSDGPLRGVFHCFNGTMDILNYILKNHPNFYFGLGGVSTFKNAGMDMVIPSIPLEKIVLETDAPYLSPVPYRGKRNEPAYMLHTAQKVADLKQMPVGQLAEITTDNAKKLFNL